MNFFTEKKTVLTLLLIVFFLSGCCFKLTKHNLPAYQTNCVYKASIKQVKEVIKESLDNKQFRNMYLCENEEKNCWAVSKGILNKPENMNDSYLYSYESIGHSVKYFSWWGNLSLYADFHIHLDSINVNNTRVSVRIINPEVVTGIKFGRGDNGTFLKPCYQSVESSTIEEYEILYLIGVVLNEKELKPIDKP
jgi:hypothetical protein